MLGKVKPLNCRRSGEEAARNARHHKEKKPQLPAAACVEKRGIPPPIWAEECPTVRHHPRQIAKEYPAS